MQTCTAPDYILVPAEAQDKLIEAFTEVFKTFYPDGALKSDSYSRIVSNIHFKRVKGLLDATKGKIALGGETDEEQRFIAPTIVRDVTFEDSLMSEEIFGPILPIIPVKDVDQAIELINTQYVQNSPSSGRDSFAKLDAVTTPLQYTFSQMTRS